MPERFGNPTLDGWWATCTADEQERLGKVLDKFLDAKATPASVLDHLAGIAICNFAVDRLRNIIDARLVERERMLDGLTLEELGWLLEGGADG